uniref:U6 snRNA phosphodiesterase 1 n=1 Tax=Lutzomyia longipalpis TaxID=7200 RepID=A0A1B0CX26_LUTLO
MLVDYSSSEEEADDDKVQDSVKSFSKISSENKLPSAIELLGEISRNTYEDVPEEHEGRIRSFGHERGNWATFCYIPFDRNEGILKLQTQIKDSAREELNLQLNRSKQIFT